MKKEVQVSISTNYLRNYGLNTVFAMEEKAREIGAAIADHYGCENKIVNVEVSGGSSGFGASDIDTTWFRVTYLNGKDKNVIRSKQGNFNDYAGMKRLWRAHTQGTLSELLA